MAGICPASTPLAFDKSTARAVRAARASRRLVRSSAAAIPRHASNRLRRVRNILRRRQLAAAQYLAHHRQIGLVPEPPLDGKPYRQIQCVRLPTCHTRYALLSGANAAATLPWPFAMRFQYVTGKIR